MNEHTVERIVDDAFTIYHMTGVTRYNNQLMLKQENIAEHSYMVAVITEIICSGLDIDKDTHLTALRYAIIHDVPEVSTGDIIASTKAMIPSLGSELSNLELRIMNDRFPYLLKTYSELHNVENEFARDIMKLADYISVKVCMKRESMLGNKSTFINVIDRDVDKKIELFRQRISDRLSKE